MTPPTPAMPDARAKASSLARGTSMPAAAAARSLARTARKRRPVPLRRRLATMAASRHSTTTQKIDELGSVRQTALAARELRSMPKHVGSFTMAWSRAPTPVSWSFSK